MIHHYYHLYADGDWQVPLKEHIEAIEKITDPIQVRVGIVGSPENMDAAASALPREGWDLCAIANQGWEQVTLNALFRELPEIDGPVLYAHTKGAANPSKVNDAWRRCMTHHNIIGWSRAVRYLDYNDLVGCHWLTPQQYPEAVQIPFFGGNFWWATPEYLRTLPEPSMETRHHAEAWVGTGDPHIAELVQGWPGLHCTSH